MGHCLGLYHTHSGRGCDFANCAEAINGSNCEICGDLVCDTPADPCLSGRVDGNCNYTGGGGFNPDTGNIQSYTLYSCMTHFTDGQVDRMHTIIENSSLLANVLCTNCYGIDATISGPYLVCYSGAQFTMNNLPRQASVVWSASSNTTINASTGYASASNNNVHGYGWVKASLTCGTVEKTKVTWVGKFESTFVEGQADVCPGNMYTYEAQVPGGHQSSYNYTWTKPANWTVMAQYDNFTRLYVPLYNPDYGTVRVSITNTCGASGYSGITVYPGYGCGYYLVYPNPASEQITISYNEDSLNRFPDGESKSFEVIIYDKNINNVYKGNSDGSDLIVKTSGFPEGKYYVNIVNNDRVEQKTIIISHRSSN